MKKIIIGAIACIIVLAVALVCFNLPEDNFGLNNETEALFNEQLPLFAAQDRCDVDGDRYNVYYYNYKGDLLDAPNGNIGFYAENGLAPAIDQNTGKVGFVDKEGVFQIEPKYGIVENGETVVPFEYDEICRYGDYFVAIKYSGGSRSYNQVFDIYDIEYNKTAENIQYAFSHRSDPYGSSCQLPNGYFQIMEKNADYEQVCGIIDYTGK